MPAIGIGFADNLDVAGIDCGLNDFKLTFVQDIGVRISRGAFDKDIVAFGLGGEYGLGLKAANFLVVKGNVIGGGVFDQAVIANNRDAFVGCLLYCGTN